MSSDYQSFLWPRLIYSCLVTSCLQVIPLLLYSLYSSFNILQPISWLQTTIFTLLSIRTWFILVPLNVVLFLLGYSLFSNYTRPHICYKSRLEIALSFFTKRNITNFVLYCVTGFLIPWSYLLANNKRVAVQCSALHQNQQCVNESTIFIILCGVWSGLYYFLWRDLCTEKCLTFPIVHKTKFIQIKSQICTTFKESISFSKWPTFYFIILYYWKGLAFLNYFQKTLDLRNELPTISSISGLFNIPLLIHAWLMSTLVIFTLMTLKRLLFVYMTSHHSFPFFSQENEITLLSGLSMTDVPIMNYLAFYDLFVVSTSNSFLRSEIYTLSQPGGHPRTWNKILEDSLSVMQFLSSELNTIYKAPEITKSPVPAPRHVHEFQTNLSPTTRFSYTGGLRNLIDQGSPFQPLQTRCTDTQENLLVQKVKDFGPMFYQIPFINYICGPIPHAKAHYLVRNSQPVIWAAQSISSLAAFSLKEDRFGIVLRDLPSIISNLLKLKYAVDKVHNVGSLSRKFHKNEDFDLLMRNSLKSAIKQSLYKISTAYSGYLKDLPLSPQEVQSLNNFVNFREC